MTTKMNNDAEFVALCEEFLDEKISRDEFVGRATMLNSVTFPVKEVKEVAKPLIATDALIDQTYNGKSGCACGCGGDYTEEGDNTGKAKGRINKINKAYANNPLDVQIFDWSDRIMYEMATSDMDSNDEFYRLTRVYVKKVGN